MQRAGPGGVQGEQRARPERPGPVAVHQPAALQGLQEPGGGGLRQAELVDERAEGARRPGLDDQAEQGAGAFDGLAARLRRRHEIRLKVLQSWNRCSVNCGYCDAGRPARQGPAAGAQPGARTRQRAENRMFRNGMPRYEILSDDAMSTLDGGWRRLVSEIGVEFGDARALELFRQAGQKVEDETSSASTPTSCSSRSPRRPGRSTCRPATRRTPCTSATTPWRSAPSTVRPSCARARCAATPRWTTSATSPASRRASPCSTRRAGSSASRRTRRSTRGIST